MRPIDIFYKLNSELSAYDWVGWDIDTLLYHYPDADDKMLAVKSCAFNSTLTCTNWQAFEKVIHAFNNNVCKPDEVQPATVEELYYGMAQIKLVIKAVHPNAIVLFTGDIPNYVASCAKYYGWTILPDELAFAQTLLMHISDFPASAFDKSIESEETKTRIAACINYDPELVET